MNDLSIVFENTPVRNVLSDETLMFVGKDVCNAMGIPNASRAIAEVNPKYKGMHKVNTLGGQQEMLCVDYRGVYELAFKSRREEALKFQEFVFDLLEQARQGKLLTLEQVNAALEQQKAELNAENLKLIQIVNVQHETINAMDGMFDPAGCQDMGSAVKILREYFCDEGSTLVGRNKLFAFLRDTKVLMHNNMPYQAYAKHFVHNKITGTTFLKNSSIGWLKRFVHKRVPKKASVLQIAHTRKMFDLNIQE